MLPTIGLYSLTTLSTAQIAGTAICTHIGTGLAGTLVYARSGHLRTARTAVILSIAALVGTPAGVLINVVISAEVFGWVLAVFLVVVALLLLRRIRGPVDYRPPGDVRHPADIVIITLGVAVAVASGIVGVGGPMLSVPLLIASGTPILESLAAAQVQSIVIASVGTIGYLIDGAINWPLAIAIGIPEVLGVIVGWKIANSVPTLTLSRILVVALVLLAPYMALG